jgi:hypothetical protein
VHPKGRRDLARFFQLDHVHGGASSLAMQSARELTMMRWGTATARGRVCRHQHQEHVVTALAGLAQA